MCLLPFTILCKQIFLYENSSRIRLSAWFVMNVWSCQYLVDEQWFMLLHCFKRAVCLSINITITDSLFNPQVSLLLKESFIESFPSRDRPFMKVCSLELHICLMMCFLFAYFFLKINKPPRCPMRLAPTCPTIYD